MRYIITEEDAQNLVVNGYDGINWDGGEYSVLAPHQVKNAVYNNGNYDSADADYYHQSDVRRTQLSSRLFPLNEDASGWRDDINCVNTNCCSEAQARPHFHRERYAPNYNHSAQDRKDRAKSKAEVVTPLKTVRNMVDTAIE